QELGRLAASVIAPPRFRLRCGRHAREAFSVLAGRPAIVARFGIRPTEGVSITKTMPNTFHPLKWTLFPVIAVFILGFVFWSGGPSQDPASQVVAKVGNERITAVEFDRQYRAQVERYRQMYQGNFSPELERALDLPKNVLDSMIERMLRLEAAQRMNLSVSDKELAEKIVTLPFFQEAGQFIGREKYERMLRGNGISPERFEEELREDLLLQKYGDLVKASVVVPESELLREYAARNDKATIEYILVPAGRIESNA